MIASANKRCVRVCLHLEPCASTERLGERLLENKVAIITGGGSGIGRASSLLYAQHGAKVMVVDFNGPGAKETARMINNNGGSADSMQADVSDEDQNAAVVAATVGKWGKLDIFFANAGIAGTNTMGGHFDSTTGEDFATVLGVNTIGAFLGLKYAQRVREL